jgi:hypothetical protein
MITRCLSFLPVLLLAMMSPTSLAIDRLPDLGMAQLRDFSIDNNTVAGRRLLRFTTIIVNVGAGPFELHGQRAATNDPDMNVSQRIYNNAGGFRDISTSAVMYWAGDGHNHWHVRDLETYELNRLDNGAKVGTGAKHGFCFYDNYKSNLFLPGAPQAAVYLTCGKDSSALAVTTGLSVGWGDRYGYTLHDQYIDITGLGAGRYRLKGTADFYNWFLESNETNNSTWVDIQFRGKGSGIKILSYGPYY